MAISGTTTDGPSPNAPDAGSITEETRAERVEEADDAVLVRDDCLSSSGQRVNLTNLPCR